jgi:Tfp pilus assembly protein PilO
LPEWVVALRGWMGRQPKLSLIAGGMALLLLCWGVYVPPLMAIRRMGTRWSQLKLEMSETRRLTDRVRRGEMRLLPSQQQLPDLLQELHVQARECQVKLLEITPGRVDFPDPAKPALLPVQMRLEGGYRSIAEFLGRLRTEPSLGVITVRTLRLDREEQLMPRQRVQLSIEIALKAGSDP